MLIQQSIRPKRMKRRKQDYLIKKTQNLHFEQTSVS